jgi:hypothetical protein
MALRCRRENGTLAGGSEGLVSPIPNERDDIPIEIGSRVFIDFGDPELTALLGRPWHGRAPLQRHTRRHYRAGPMVCLRSPGQQWRDAPVPALDA